MAARSISELITGAGKINLDFKDVDTTLRKGGAAIISSGYGEGEHRVTKAIQDALNSPLLRNRDVYSAKRILINCYFSRNAEDAFKMSEISEMREFMCNFEEDLDVIFGQAFDDSLGDKVKITVLAAGFNVTDSIYKEAESMTTRRPTRPAEAPQPDDLSQKRLEDEYGEKIRQQQLQMAAARYLVLTQKDIENDDIIDLLEKTPTYGRDMKFKEKVKEMQSGAQSAAEAQPSSQNSHATISFTEE